jgi:hypothetical protein
MIPFASQIADQAEYDSKLFATSKQVYGAPASTPAEMHMLNRTCQHAQKDVKNMRCKLSCLTTSTCNEHVAVPTKATSLLV